MKLLMVGADGATTNKMKINGAWKSIPLMTLVVESDVSDEWSSKALLLVLLVAAVSECIDTELCSCV